MLRLFSWIGFAIALGLAGMSCATRPLATDARVVVFSARQPGCAIVVPVDAVPAERRAAELMQATLAEASSLPPAAFPIETENPATSARGIFVGATRRAAGLADFLPSGSVPPFDTAVGFAAAGETVIVRSERRIDCEMAASWFLERQVGAHWFMPGPLGEAIPRRAELAVATGREVARPGFVSRDLGGIDGDANGRAWFARNRLVERFEFAHHLGAIFPPEELRQHPEMAPMRAGRRYIPSDPSDYNWQPDLTNAAAIEHAAAAARAAFAADPNRLSFSLGENDSIRFDDSAATSAAVAPPRFFRHRPDYSDLVFGFANAVADRVRPAYPDRWLPTLAYYWAENTPRFPVAKNVVPYLTADRTQWFDPDFAAEDRALIAQWCRSGAGLVGIYDYLYGAPLLLPRPALDAVGESIPFEYRAGVRTYYAEMSPNWALDGPKPWLAAQLLWAPEQDPAALLDTYYREFWGEAAVPMREFFARGERAWRGQPRPAYWIKYYQDEHQAALFPPAVRAELRARLAAAQRLARTEAVRARVAFVAAGFSASDAFGDFCAARDRLSAFAHDGAKVDGLGRAWLDADAARRTFLVRHAEVRAGQPLALAPQSIDIYVRNDPAGRAAHELARSAEGRRFLTERAFLPWMDCGATADDLVRLAADGRELLADAPWSALAIRPVGGAADFEWTTPGSPWRGNGEPFETRRIVRTDVAGADSGLRFSGCRQESLGRWIAATPGALYEARVRVRAKVSPGNATFLILSFLDENQRHIGLGHVDRLPAAAATQELELDAIARAPREARYVGLGVRVTNQVNDDFAEFAGASLRSIPAPTP
ncbi:MAG TPA: DUF4838 domain-containing protein [Opitutaceae bacterium]|nr:DUF4838 domain-containing protein [Opitutaceae bacterium]